MNFKDYEGVWKRQELPVGADADLASLKSAFEAKRRKQAVTLFARDLIEALAGVVCLGAYGQYWWQIGQDGWPMGFAMALILGVTLFFVRERLRTRRIRLSADATLLAKIESDIAELRHQRRLLLKVWAWYLAPILAAIFLHASVIFRVKPPNLEGTLFLGIFLGLFFWLAWAINRQAVRKWIEPRLAELEKLHRELVACE